MNKSLTGFWPHPEKENFNKRQAPWKVPKKRKSKGKYYHYYDHSKESVQFTVGAEVTTSNRFQVLTEEDSLANQIFPPEEVSPPEERMFADIQTQPPEETSFSEERSFFDFMNKDNKCINNNNYFLFERNKNFCSGYFPNFITLDDELYYHMSNNINHNYYYLREKNEKYLKYLSNNKSKYNNEYFDKLKYAYEISNTNPTKLLDTHKLKKKRKK